MKKLVLGLAMTAALVGAGFTTKAEAEAITYTDITENLA